MGLTKNKKKVHRPVKAKKSAKNERKRLNPRRIAHPGLRAVYDKKKTWSENLKSVNMKDVFGGDNLPESIPDRARHLPKLNEQQVDIVEKLYKKHKTDYEAMVRDIRINKWQWTQHKCEKYVKGFCIDKTITQRSEEAEMLSGRGIDLEKSIFGKDRERNVFGH